MQKSILVPVDFSEVTSKVISEAAALATDTGHRLSLLHVVNPTIVTTPYYITAVDIARELQERVKRAQERLEKHAAELREKNFEVSIEVLQGEAARSIVKAAEKPEIRYIVIGSHGHGRVYDLLVGSTAHGILRRAKTPVVIVPLAS